MSRTSAVNQSTLDIVIVPVTNPSFAIGRDIGRRDAERRGRERQSTRKLLLSYCGTGCVLRRVTVAAGQDGIDEIISALD